MTKKLNSSLWKYKSDYYDLEPFFNRHPGGTDMLEMARGKQCEDVMHVHHRLSNKNIEAMMPKYKVERENIVIDDEHLEADNGGMFDWHSPFHTELTAKVKNHFNGSIANTKSPILFTIAIALLLAIDYYFLFQGVANGSFLMVFLITILHMCLGFSLFHTASHSAWSTSPTVNWTLEYSWSVFTLFFPSIWKQHHVMLHHTYTGIHKKDVDVAHALPFIRKSTMSRYRVWFAFQHIYAVFFYLVATGQWSGQSISYIISMFRNKLFGATIKPNFHNNVALKWNLFGIGLFLFLFIFYPYFIFGHSMWSCLYVLSAFILAMNFMYWLHVFPNHDLDICSHSHSHNRDWSIQQISTSTYYYMPYILAELTGRMMSQNIHHLFPTVHPAYYPQLLEITKQHCTQHGVYFPETTFVKMFNSYFKFLKAMSIGNSKKQM